MKIAFPHMGNLSIALETAIAILGGEPIVPPYSSKKTLSIGTRNSPEAVCLPYKIVLGNYVEAIEAGAEAVLMIDSPGICRLGQYSDSARMALSDMGHDVQFINFDLYKGKLKEVYTKFKLITGNGNPFDLFRAINVALIKIDLLDQLDHETAYYRAREINIGDSDKVYTKSVSAIRKTMTAKDTKTAFKNAINSLKSLKIDENRDVIHVDLTGEIYVVLDPFSNLEIEKELGRMGVHVHRKLNLSDWTNTFLKPAFLKSELSHEEKAKVFAEKFLKRDIGGDAIESIGDTAMAPGRKSHGVVHLLPFTCMPEIISQNILPNVRVEEDIPVLSLVLDEQMGRAGYITRLEAFIDLIRRRKIKAQELATINN